MAQHHASRDDLAEQGCDIASRIAGVRSELFRIELVAHAASRHHHVQSAPAPRHSGWRAAQRRSPPAGKCQHSVGPHVRSSAQHVEKGMRKHRANFRLDEVADGGSATRSAAPSGGQLALSGPIHRSLDWSPSGLARKTVSIASASRSTSARVRVRFDGSRIRPPCP